MQEGADLGHGQGAGVLGARQEAVVGAVEGEGLEMDV